MIEKRNTVYMQLRKLHIPRHIAYKVAVAVRF